MKISQQKINTFYVIIIISIFFIGCKKDVRHLQSDQDKEGLYIITNYEDSIFISYTKYDEKVCNSDPWIKLEEDYWYIEDKEKNKKDKNGYVPLSDKIWRCTKVSDENKIEFKSLKIRNRLF